MKFLFVLFVSVVLLVLCRFIYILIGGVLYRLISKLYNKVVSLKTKDKSTRFTMSLMSIGVYLMLFFFTIDKFMVEPNYIDVYLLYTFMGILAVIWCYFKWDLSWKALPKFDIDSDIVSAKKAVIFFLVTVFVFGYGYQQSQNIFFNKKLGVSMVLFNATVIPGLLALDRLLAQISNLINSWNRNRNKKENEC